MSVSRVEAELAFVREDAVSPDPQRPPLLRAAPRDHSRPPAPGSLDLRRFCIRDCDALADDEAPALFEHGFALVDLSELTALQAALARVHEADRLEPEDVAALRRALRGRRLTTATGTRLRVLHVASEGVLMRRAGPNGLRLVPIRTPPEGRRIDDHDASENVHVDQDVDGTPLRQLMRGAAPWLLRHDSPTHRNTRSRLVVLNLWIGLQQITRPLALMDKRSFDRVRHQVAYAMTTSFMLEREAERQVNDIWAVLPDARQRWYFTGQLDARRGYLFETLGTAHGAFILPGEDLAERRYLQLGRVEVALAERDRAKLERALAPELATIPETTASLRAAIGAMDQLLDEARSRGPTLLDPALAHDWSERAKEAMQRVVRRSIELRLVAWVG